MDIQVHHIEKLLLVMELLVIVTMLQSHPIVLLLQVTKLLSHPTVLLRMTMDHLILQLSVHLVNMVHQLPLHMDIKGVLTEGITNKKVKVFAPYCVIKVLVC